MALMLAPLKCGIHFQKRKLALLIRQTSSYHVWNKSRNEPGAGHARQSTYPVSEDGAGQRGHGAFSHQARAEKKSF